MSERLEFKTEEDIRAVFAFKDGDGIFTIGDRELLRVNQNGDFFVDGKLCVNDIETYKIFKEWLEFVLKIVGKGK